MSELTLYLVALDQQTACFRPDDQIGYTYPTYELRMRTTEWYAHGRPVELPATLGPVPE